jgi:hypothetical protein
VVAGASGVASNLEIAIPRYEAYASVPPCSESVACEDSASRLLSSS